MIKKKNKIVGIINILLGVLYCINWFIWASCMKMEIKSFIDFTDEQFTTIVIFFIIMIVPLVLTFIINLIYIFRNWHNKKSMFMNILTIVTIVISVVLLVTLKSYLYMYIISIVAIWGILLLIFNKNENKEKKHIILFSIMILNIILFIIASIGFLSVKSNFEIKYINNEKNLLKSIIQFSNGSDSTLIKAQKNGKWGYINSNGKIVIDFNYDNGSEFLEIEDTNSNKKYYIALVSFENELRLITNNNKQIASYKNKKKYDKVSISRFPNELEDILEDNAESLNTKIKITESEYSSYNFFEKETKFERNYSIDEGNTLTFDISNNTDETFELTYNKKNESITYKGKKVSIDGKLYIDKDEVGDNYIDTYENGYIPIYDFNNEKFGWIDLKGQAHYISGKIQVLDFTDKYIVVKDYSIMGDAKIYIVDYQGNRVSDFYKEISILDKGFVVKNQNGKNVYLDDNFRQITQEYDIIDTCRINDGILIVANFYRKANNTANSYYNYYSLNDLSFDLINIISGKVIGTDFEYINGLNDFKYKANYFDDLTDDEFKELLCSVDCDYLNTKLYERYYK